MKFLLYTTTYGKSGSIQLNRPTFWVPALLGVCALLLGAGRVGYMLADPQASLAQVAPADQQWMAALDEQKNEV